MPWIVVLALAWGNPDSRINSVGEVIKIERIEVATEAQCKKAADDWPKNTYAGRGYEYTQAWAVCVGQKSPP